MVTKKIGVCLLNMGGPKALPEVQPFLYNLFSDRDLIRLPMGKWLQKPFSWSISRLRAAKVQKYYAEIGGGSPLGRLTDLQARSLEAMISPDNIFPVVVAMRYCSPRAFDAITCLKEHQIERCVLLPLYPHFSGATTGSSLNDFYRELAAQGLSWDILAIKDYHDHPQYLAALASVIAEGLASVPKDTPVIFSAHSLPQRMIDQGDPYARQIERTVEAVVKELNLSCWKLGYQSRSGPVRWLGPDLLSVVDQFIDEGAKHLLLVPVSFVSDHIETLHEIDIRLQAHCQKRGLKKLVRVPSLNDNPLFIKALRQIVLEKCQTDLP